MIRFKENLRYMIWIKHQFSWGQYLILVKMFQSVIVRCCSFQMFFSLDNIYSFTNEFLITANLEARKMKYDGLVKIFIEFDNFPRDRFFWESYEKIINFLSIFNTGQINQHFFLHGFSIWKKNESNGCFWHRNPYKLN